MENNIKIYGSLLSANVRKVLITAQELEITFELQDVNVYKGDGQSEQYLPVNLLGQIPTIVDNKFTLRESNAIICYLAQKKLDKKFYGMNLEQQAEINQWLFWESSQWQPLLVDIMSAHVGNKLLPEVITAPKSAPNWETENSLKQLNFLENNLKEGWLVGSQFSLADISVAAMTTYFHVSNFPFTSYPNISKWYDSLCQRMSWQKTEHPLWKDV